LNGKSFEVKLKIANRNVLQMKVARENTTQQIIGQCVVTDRNMTWVAAPASSML